MPFSVSWHTLLDELASFNTDAQMQSTREFR